MLDQVEATEAALELIEDIKKDYGDVIFHQSGGCCDGSAPMCFQKGDFLIADHDVQMGEIGGVPFYIGGLQFEAWKHTRLIIDVVEGQGGMFSLDNGRGKRFITRSELCSVLFIRIINQYTNIRRFYLPLMTS